MGNGDRPEEAKRDKHERDDRKIEESKRPGDAPQRLELTQAERTERARVVQPTDARGRAIGVGHPYGSDEFDPKELKETLKNRDEEMPGWREKKDLVTRIQSHASRVGGDKANRELTDRRAERVRNALRDAGVQGVLIAESFGERAAREGGKREFADDATDRRTVIRPDGAVRERADSHREALERGEVAQPRDGIGFKFDSAEVDTRQVDRWIKDLPADKRQALQDPDAKLRTDVSASRPGSDAHNIDLTNRRTQNLVRVLTEKYGVKAQIEAYSLGAQPAKDAGKAAETDDRNDRVARMDVTPAEIERPVPPDVPPDVGKALDSMRGLRKAPDDRHAAEQAEMVKDSVKAGLKTLVESAAKGDPTALEKAALKTAKKFSEKELKWMGRQLLKDLETNKRLGPIVAEVPHGVSDRLSALANVDRRSFDQIPPPYRSEALRAAGEELMQEHWDGLPQAERDNIVRVMRSSDRARFEKQMLETVTGDQIRRAAQH